MPNTYRKPFGAYTNVNALSGAQASELTTNFTMLTDMLNGRYTAFDYPKFERMPGVFRDNILSEINGLVTTMGGGGTGPSNPAISGLTNANTTALRAAIQGAIAGTTRGRIQLIGDSTMYGSYANSTSISSKVLSVPYYLMSQLTASLCPAEINSMMGAAHIASMAAYQGYDPRWSTGWTVDNSHDYYGGYLFTSSTIGQQITWTPGGTFDTIELYYLEPAAGRSYDVIVGGITVFTIQPTSGAATFTKKVTISLGAPTSAVTFSNNVAAAVYLNGIQTYTASQNKLAIMGAGIPGGVAADWNAAAANYAPGRMILAYAADHTFYELIINDAVLGTNVTTYGTTLQSLVTKALGSGGCTLVVGNMTDPTFNSNATPQATQQLYRQKIYDIAAANNIAVIDMWTQLGTWAEANALGYMFDQSHLLAVGNAVKAAAYYDFCAMALSA